MRAAAITAWAVAVPQVVVTWAVNCSEPDAETLELTGEIATERTLSVTVTVAVAVELLLAWLVATTW